MIASINPLSCISAAILAGGASLEREISLLSGNHVLAAMEELSIPAKVLDPADQSFDYRELYSYDCVFIALHGAEGENGAVQGMLDCLRIPYTGSGVLASALAMDKQKSKLLWKAHGLPVPEGRLFSTEEALALSAAKRLFADVSQLVVKPVHAGSSIGLSLVSHPEELQLAIEKLRPIDTQCFVERFLSGSEYSVAIVGDHCFPAIQIIPFQQPLYDYHAKYHSSLTQYRCPGDLTASQEQELQTIAWAAYQALGCRGWGRVDFRMDDQQHAHLLEINTVPGLSPKSLVPMAAAAANLHFTNLIQAILYETQRHT